MKKIYIVLSLILILTFRYYYEHEDKMLDKALIYAKENRYPYACHCAHSILVGCLRIF